MQGLRFWSQYPEPQYDPNKWYYFVSNEDSTNILAWGYTPSEDFIGLSSFNPDLSSVTTPKFMTNTSITPISRIEYFWFRKSNPSHVAFTVIYRNQEYQGGAELSYDTISITGITPQDRMYVKNVIVPDPVGSNNITFRNDWSIPIHLEFRNSSSVLIYSLVAPPNSTVSENCPANLSTVSKMSVCSPGHGVGLGFRAFGVSRPKTGFESVLFAQMGTGGGTGYSCAERNVSIDNSYYPLIFYGTGDPY